MLRTKGFNIFYFNWLNSQHRLWAQIPGYLAANFDKPASIIKKLLHHAPHEGS